MRPSMRWQNRVDDVRPLSDLDIITLRSNLRLRERSVALACRVPREASQP
jgi:hypothetical protein